MFIYEKTVENTRGVYGTLENIPSESDEKLIDSEELRYKKWFDDGHKGIRDAEGNPHVVTIDGKQVIPPSDEEPTETFTVTFKAAGGIWADETTDDKEVTVEKGQAATAPEAPTKEGNTFDGWDPADFSNITSDLTVTAKWKENTPTPTETFTVTFKANGGTWTDGTTEDKEVTVEKGKAATAPDEPTQEGGYTFNGWDPEDFSNITSDLTVTAQWLSPPAV